jgi:hypothetical protein
MCDTHRLNSTTRPAAPRSDSRPAVPRSDSRPFSEVKRRPLRPTAIAKKV